MSAHASYRLVTSNELSAVINTTIETHLVDSGFGSFNLILRPSGAHSSQIWIEDAVHFGLEMCKPDVMSFMRRQAITEADIQTEHQLILELVYQKLVAILSSNSRHGKVTVSFERTRNNRWAKVLVGGGISHKVQVPILTGWL